MACGKAERRLVFAIDEKKVIITLNSQPSTLNYKVLHLVSSPHCVVLISES